MNQTPISATTTTMDLLGIPPHLQTGGYPALLADHCQTVDQLAALTVVVMKLWDLNNEMRCLLGLPHVSLPIAGSLACAARTANVTPCAPATVVPLAGEEG